VQFSLAGLPDPAVQRNYWQQVAKLLLLIHRSCDEPSNLSLWLIRQ